MAGLPHDNPAAFITGLSAPILRGWVCNVYTSENEAAYRARNREACNARIREWKAKNPHKLTHYFHKRRAAELQAMPAWADLDAIEAIYAEAQRIQAETGEPQHVDHIVPIISKLVCGLHCEANLRVLPAVDNLRKNNRNWPDMP